MPVQKISKGLFAAMLLLLLGLFMTEGFSLGAVGVAAVLLLALVALWQGIQRLTEKVAKRWVAALLPLYFILLFAAGCLLAVEPAWDFGRVFGGALDLAEHGTLTVTLQYFLESNNNFFIAYLLSYWFKIASLIGLAPLYAGILLNCLAIWLSVAALLCVVWRGWGAKNGLLFLVIAFCCLPLYTYAPIFYTDTLSLPFVGFGVLLWQQIRHKSHLGWLLLLGVNGFVGYQLKASVGILYVAMFLFAIARPTRKKCLRVAVVALTMVVLALGYQALLQLTKPIDLTEIDRYRLPPQHYLMMGLAGKGGYNPEDHMLSTGISDLQLRKETNVAEIKTRLANYGLGGYLSFLAGKIEYTWLDGTYYAPWKLSIDPLHTNLLSAYCRVDGAHYDAYRCLTQGGQLALLLMMLRSLWGAGAWRQMFARKRGAKPGAQKSSQTDAASEQQNTFSQFAARVKQEKSCEALIALLSLSVFGLFAFLLLWETRSRYLVNFIPVFLLLAQHGLAQVRLPHKAASQPAQQEPAPSALV